MFIDCLTYTQLWNVYFGYLRDCFFLKAESSNYGLQGHSEIVSVLELQEDVKVASHSGITRCGC